MASTVILKASGLYTSPNHLSIPEGALSEAKNIIIKRDGIVEQRRGFKIYGSELPLASDRVDQLTIYRNTILRHYGSKLQYDSDKAGNFQTFLGDFLPADPMLRMKFIEASGNLFFTSSNGIQKLSSKTAAGLSTAEVVKAGAVKAIDLEARTVYVPNLQTGFLPQDSAISYRVLWAYKDANNNLIQGSPSQRELVYNRQIDLMLRDYMCLLGALDSLDNTPLTSARINDKNYVSLLGLQAGSTTADLRARLISLAAKLDNDILYADSLAAAPLQVGSASITGTIATITFASGDPSNYLQSASLIYLEGFSPATGVLDGAQTVVSVTSTTITFNTTATGAVTLTTPTIKSNEFRSITQPTATQIPAIHLDNMDVQDYFSNILAALRDMPTGVISTADQLILDEIDLTTSTNVELTITIPQDVDSRYFYQVYRSSIFSASDQQTIDDVIPNDELQLVYEAYPTPQELIDREVVITDVTPDDFRGANLYTNNSTGEGILQSNDPPPYAKDINRYRNVVFYANTRTKHTMLLSLLGVQAMINDYNNGITPSITIANVDTVNTYPFVTGLNEVTEITTVADFADSLNGTYFLIDATTGSKFYVWFETTTATDPAISGRTGVKVSIDTNDTADIVASRLRDALSIYLDDFIVSSLTNVVMVENVEFGALNDAQDVDTGFTFTITQQGRGERVQTEISTINTISGASFVSSGAADYFEISTALNRDQYYFWFKSGTAVSPGLVGKIGINIDIDGTETADDVALKIIAALPAGKFQSSVASNVVTIENTQYGVTSPISENVVDAGFTVTTLQEGAIEVLLSTNASPAIAVDETARSLIRVINRNEGDSVYGFYLSGAFDVPGKMVLEARNLEVEDQFFIVANNDNTGASFNPDISPDVQITSITTGANPVITTDAPHGLENLDFVVIGATDSQAPIDGVYEITYISPTSFSIDKFVSVAGTKGAAIRATNAVTSENDVKQNRVYYSKYSQPEAVPVSNYFDVGAEDKQILRVFPLRDSLFIFKEDGLYRISGESAPFTLDLFDSSFIVTAPDSVNVCNNVVFAWTTQGIQSLTESGGSVVSRSIDNLILKLGSVNYTNFKTVTFGVGYESDNSFLIWTVQETDDTVATIAYRFSTLTQTWTTYDLPATAGIINSADDKLYFGAGDTNFITQERKLFDRTDYADREIAAAFANNFLVKPGMVKLNSVTGYSVGDVLTQDQTITTFEFNTFLEKLDYDPGVGENDYLSTLQLKAGDNPRSRLLALANKLDVDPNVATTDFASSIADYSGTITNISDGIAVITSAAHNLMTGRVVLITNSDSTPSINGTYSVTVINANQFSIPVAVKLPGTTGNWQTLGQNQEDLKDNYNLIVSKLNLDAGVAFSNYRPIDDNTLQETIITAINTLTRQITLNLALDYMVGDITIYKAIETTLTYLPVTMGDPLSMKHIREATLMFETRNITGGSVFFASDLMPELLEIPFKLAGNGIFGHDNFGAGQFGGMSNSAPMRTYIPRQCQRCRYLVTKVLHKTAREDYRLLGITLTGNESQTTRAYR